MKLYIIVKDRLKKVKERLKRFEEGFEKQIFADEMV